MKTQLDIEKQNADFLLLSCSPYVIKWKDGTIERVNKRRLNKLQASLTWLTDF